jgi:hypothetical protein
MNIDDVIAAKMATRTEEQALAAFRKAAGKSNATAALARLWRDLVGIHYPNVYQPAMTGKQQGQLKAAYRLAGNEFIAALPRVIAHWDDFLLYLKLHGVESAKGLYGVAPVPRVNVVLACVQHVVQFDVDARAAEAAPLPHGAAAPVPLTKYASKVQTAEKPDKAEALALLEEALREL